MSGIFDDSLMIDSRKLFGSGCVVHQNYPCVRKLLGAAVRVQSHSLTGLRVLATLKSQRHYSILVPFEFIISIFQSTIVGDNPIRAIQ